MTFWIDAQLDPELAPWLGSRFGVMAKHLIDLGLAQSKDEDLYAAAARFREVVIMSKDKDFADLSRRLGSPPQILLIRCGNLTTVWMQALLSSAFPNALQQLQQGSSLVEIVGP